MRRTPLRTGYRVGTGEITVDLSITNQDKTPGLLPLSFRVIIRKSGMALVYKRANITAGSNPYGYKMVGNRVKPATPKGFENLLYLLKTKWDGRLKHRAVDILKAIVPAEYQAKLEKALQKLATEALVETAGGA